MKRMHGYWLMDNGAPIDWPLYQLRVQIARRWPRLYALMWNDWR
jgi:hypothetical protein